MGNLAAVYETWRDSNPIADDFGNEGRGLWYVVQVQPRKERHVLATLVSSGIAGYVPFSPKTQRLRGSRSRRVYEPLIRGYVFIRFAPGQERFGAVGAIEEVIDFLRAASGAQEPAPAVIDHAIMVQIVHKETALCVDKRTNRDFEVGQEVEAVDGPWQFFKGQVESLFKDDRIRVAITAYGRVVPVLFPASMIKAV